jgi:hypothetical protein
MIRKRPDAPHRIEISARDIGQLFNTMDPSPFHEKDLDADAEEFILSWAQEFPVRDPVVLIVHVAELKDGVRSQAMLEQAVQHYFLYRAKLGRLEFRRLMREARISLLIGITFLCLCLAGGQLLMNFPTQGWHNVAREGLTIVGWVAMWRPVQMYLYDWWPVRRRVHIFRKMSRMTVEVHTGGQ